MYVCMCYNWDTFLWLPRQCTITQLLLVIVIKKSQLFAMVFVTDAICIKSGIKKMLPYDHCVSTLRFGMIAGSILLEGNFTLWIFLSFLHNAHENDLITLMKCNVSKTLQSTITMKDISKTNSHKCIRLGTLLLALLNLTNSIFFLS